MKPCYRCQRSINGIFNVQLSNNIKNTIMRTYNLKNACVKDVLDKMFSELILQEEYQRTLFMMELSSNLNECCLSCLKCVYCQQEQFNDIEWKKDIHVYQFTLKLLLIEKRLFSV